MTAPRHALITADDLRSFLNPQTVDAVYDDDGDGHLNSDALDFVIDMAEAQVFSYVARVYTGPFPPTAGPFGTSKPNLLKLAALLFASAYTLQRHPDYVRTFGEEKRAEREAKATALCERIADGMQFLSDNTSQTVPKNAGGILLDEGPRMMVSNADGTRNEGDF